MIQCKRKWVQAAFSSSDSYRN